MFDPKQPRLRRLDRRLAFALFLVALVALPREGTAEGQYDFISLFSSSVGVVFFPSINNSGAVTFSESEIGGAARLWFVDERGSILLEENPDDDIFAPVINDVGQVVAVSNGALLDQALRRYEVGVSPIDLATAPLDFYSMAPGGLAINESGDAVLLASENLFSGSFYRVEYDEATQISQITDVVELGEGLVESGLSLAIDDAGNVYFEATSSGEGPNLYVAGESDATLHATPPAGCSTSIGEFSGNAGGTVLATSGACAFEVSSAGVVTLVVPPEPDVQLTLSLSPISISDNGRTLLFGSFDVTGETALYTGPNPISDRLVAIGDSLFGGTIEDLQASRQAINDSGQVVFWALIGNEVHIVRADPIVEALSPSLSVAGSCPGPVTVQIEGATPNASIALLFSSEVGFSTVPMGGCEGAPLDLESPTLLTVLPLDGTGSAVLDANAPPGACSATLQAVDLGCCAVSGPVALP